MKINAIQTSAETHFEMSHPSSRFSNLSTIEQVLIVNYNNKLKGIEAELRTTISDRLGNYGAIVDNF